MMTFNFRQGIVVSQRGSVDFISINPSNNSIDLNANKTPLQLNFSHGNSNYYVSINNSIPNAWTFKGDTWFYWDIDLLTGQLSRGTTKNYLGYGENFPTSKIEDSHFFNTLTHKMYVFNSGRWIEKIRLFSGNIQNGVLYTETIGSQINEQVTVRAGSIVFDFKNRPIPRFQEDGSFEFITTETFNNFQHTNLSNMKFSGVQLRGISSVEDSKFLCVNWGGDSTLKLADYRDEFPAFALLSENAKTGELISIITHGFVTNKSWRWLDPENTLVFLSENGEITTHVPQTHSIQNVGYIVNPFTIFFKFGKQIFINPIEVPPSPTPTPSITPSNSRTPNPTSTSTQTPTPSVTPTHTSTPTKTPQKTPTPSPTNTQSSTATQTPTSTQQATTTITPTPTVTNTPTNTQTPTNTITPTLTPSITPTFTPTLSKTVTITPSWTSDTTPSPTSTPSLTPTNTITPTPTLSSTITPTVTSTNVPTLSATPTQTVTTTTTVTPTVTTTLTPTITNTITPTQTLTQTFTPTVTPTPSNTPTLTTTITPTSSITPTPTLTQTLTPTNTQA